MRIWMAVGGVFALLGLLSLVRFGCEVDYSGQGLLIRVLLGPAHISVFPLKKRERTTARKEKPLTHWTGLAMEGNPLGLLQTYLPLVAESAGRLRRKIRVEWLGLDLTVAASTPAFAAVSFGAANGALGIIIPLLEQNFHIRERRIRTGISFEQKEATVSFQIVLTLTVGQGISLASFFAWRMLGILREQSRRKRVQKRVVSR